MTRPKSEQTRIYGPPGFVEWIQSLPSVASGKGPCEAAHVGTGGMGRKGDWTSIIPLTVQEHRAELHQWGPRTFEARYRLSLADEVAMIQRLWRQRMAA